MNTTVGSYEAKTRLPELLRGVLAGNRYTAIAVDEMLLFMQTMKP
jgi:antitoxin (DNA-binding transcriptional repressor) of toxin-antitoxin stability system